MEEKLKKKSNFFVSKKTIQNISPSLLRSEADEKVICSFLQKALTKNTSIHDRFSTEQFSEVVFEDDGRLFTLAISKCYGKVRVLFFPRDNSLISRGNSHVSRVRGLVVRCLLFNPEVSCSNPWVCANFFTSIPKQKVLTFFGTMRLFGFVRLFSEIF